MECGGATPTQDLVLDHFKCYPAATLAPVPTPPAVRLVDQFESKNTRLLKKFMLCNPVDKNDEGLAHPDEHLMCAAIKDAPRPSVGLLTPTPTPQPTFAPHLVQVTNQFGTATLLVEKPAWLCVPSSKIDFGH